MTLLVTVTGISACNSPQAPVFTSEDIRTASAYQQAILDDGIVTADEYRQAVIAQRDCVATRGYETTEIRAQGSLLTFDSTANYEDAPDPEKADEDFLATLENCSHEYVTFVGYAWSSSQVVPTGEPRDDMWRGLAICVNAAGVEFTVADDESVRLDALGQAMNAATSAQAQEADKCFVEYADLFIARAGG